jgi:hypothetical protein
VARLPQVIRRRYTRSPCSQRHGATYDKLTSNSFGIERVFATLFVFVCQPSNGSLPNGLFEAASAMRHQGQPLINA